MSKRQYLELMGIDVWQKRLPRQAASKPAAANKTQELVQTNESIASGAAGQSGASALASVRASLTAAGNDQPLIVTPERQAVAATAETETQEKSESIELAPEFFLAFSHFAGLSMVNLYPSGFAAIPGNHQRFLATLYFALRGQKLGSDVQEFRWPMIKSDRISQSREDAQKVLGRHLEQCQADVLVFGAESADLLNATSDHYTEQVVRNRRLVVVEDAEIYFREPSKRRELWRFLSSVKQRLKAPK